MKMYDSWNSSMNLSLILLMIFSNDFGTKSITMVLKSVNVAKLVGMLKYRNIKKNIEGELDDLEDWPNRSGIVLTINDQGHTVH